MRKSTFITLAAAVLAPAVALGCSAFTVVIGGKVLLAAHNDNPYHRNFLMLVRPAVDGLYGRVCIALDTVPGWSPMGMKCVNDQGLAITHANVPASQTPYDPDKPQFVHDFLQKIVSECKTVKQAVSMIKAYSLPGGEHGAHVHLMLADPSGEAAIVEWVDGEVKVLPRTGPTLFMTNSLLSKPGTEGPNSRLARGSRMLAEIKSARVEDAIPVMKEISVYGFVKGEEVGSIDSAAWDLTGRKLYFFYKRDFDHPLVLDLDAEMAKGSRTEELRKLFPNPVPFSTEWSGDNGVVKRKQPAN